MYIISCTSTGEYSTLLEQGEAAACWFGRDNDIIWSYVQTRKRIRWTIHLYPWAVSWKCYEHYPWSKAWSCRLTYRLIMDWALKTVFDYFKFLRGVLHEYNTQKWSFCSTVLIPSLLVVITHFEKAVNELRGGSTCRLVFQVHVVCTSSTKVNQSCTCLPLPKLGSSTWTCTLLVLPFVLPSICVC